MAKKRSGWITAAEFNEYMRTNPESRRRVEERKARHAAAVAKLQAEIDPEHTAIRRDLAAVGWPVESLSNLVNSSASYGRAIPVLVKYLGILRHPVMRDMTARALTVVEARGIAGQPLLRELRRETDPEVRWVFANALTIAANKDDVDEITALATDPAFADVHERLNQALRNVRRGTARAEG